MCTYKHKYRESVCVCVWGLCINYAAYFKINSIHSSFYCFRDNEENNLCQELRNTDMQNAENELIDNCTDDVWYIKD